ncbi:MAG TPA: YjcZ family sporulation protein [Acholeplasmataceae bacterium]|nr:YjcZ family sporulation protein [Acholeplasmataceae bacterium]
MYQKGCYGFYGNNFAFVLVLFILLVIIGASWIY